MAANKPRSFAVIGLGTFGTSLCTELSAKGAQVIAIEKQESLVGLF